MAMSRWPNAALRMFSKWEPASIERLTRRRRGATLGQLEAENCRWPRFSSVTIDNDGTMTISTGAIDIFEPAVKVSGKLTVTRLGKGTKLVADRVGIFRLVEFHPSVCSNP